MYLHLALFGLRNLRWNRFRTVLTVAGVAVAILTFVLLRAVVWAWMMGAEVAAKDRIASRHKVTFVMTLPRRYLAELQQMPEVKSATFMNWFGGKDPAHEHEFFATLAVYTPTFFDVYDEILLPDDQKKSFLTDRQGAIVGDVLAKKLGWKIGDEVSIESPIFGGDWRFHISGIYTAARKSIDRSTFFFNWDYLNESIKAKDASRGDQIGWMVARIDDPLHSADICKAVDQKFDDRDPQTLTMSERQMNVSFLGMVSAVMTAIEIVSGVILLIMMLILGNTIAMGVRERIPQYGMLRAIGFEPGHIAVAVIAEGVALGLLGGLLGLGAAYSFINYGAGPWLEENMGGLFPYFSVPPSMVGLALGLAVALSVLAALPPAWQAFRLNVVEAVRRVG